MEQTLQASTPAQAFSISSLLSIDDRRDLREFEARVTSYFRSHQQTIFALTQIRDRRLYRETHETFESYCLEKWNLSRPRAYQLIAAESVNSDLSTIVDTPLPESQARELALIHTPEERREVWAEVVQSAPGGHVTAAIIKAAVDRRTPPQPKQHVRAKPIDGLVSSSVFELVRIETRLQAHRARMKDEHRAKIYSYLNRMALAYAPESTDAIN